MPLGPMGEHQPWDTSSQEPASIPYPKARWMATENSEGRDFRVELGERLVSVSEGGSVRGPGQMIPMSDFIDFMVSWVCIEDVDLGTIVSGSLEDDSRRLCS